MDVSYLTVDKLMKLLPNEMVVAICSDLGMVLSYGRNN